MYLGALYDVLITFVGIIFNWGEEANPIFKGMQPAYMIPVTAFGYFIIGITGLIVLLKLMECISVRYSRDIDTHIKWLNRCFVFAGVYHFMTGSTWLVGWVL